MNMKKMMSILCICGLMLPFSVGCGGKKKDEKKADESVTTGKPQFQQKTIAGPAKNAGIQKKTSKYTSKTFAKKGRPHDDSESTVTTSLKKKGEAQSTEKTEEPTE